MGNCINNIIDTIIDTNTCNNFINTINTTKDIKYINDIIDINKIKYLDIEEILKCKFDIMSIDRIIKKYYTELLTDVIIPYIFTFQNVNVDQKHLNEFENIKILIQSRIYYNYFFENKWHAKNALYIDIDITYNNQTVSICNYNYLSDDNKIKFFHCDLTINCKHEPNKGFNRRRYSFNADKISKEEFYKHIDLLLLKHVNKDILSVINLYIDKSINNHCL